jgi:hypothetical protein
MKKLSLLLVAILFAVTGIMAQTPNQFKYQAVLRDASGAIMTSEAVSVDISILQGSATGTSVFDESHSVTTTAQGLINLNIGSVEDLSVVDFSADTYFIEISVNSTVMGTSQLLSVPYALQAKEVENVDYSQITNTPTIPEDVADLTDNSNLLFDGDYNSLSNLPTLFDGDYNSLTNLPTLFDGTFGSLTGTPTTISGYGITDAFDGDYNSLTNLPTLFSGSFADLSNKPTTIAGYGITDAFSGDYGDLTHTPTIDGSETKLTAGTNVTVTGTGTSEDPYVVNASSGSATHYVGELYLGGIVYWVDATGEHGLIASLDDLDGGSGVAWSDVTSVVVPGGAQDFYNGASNTDAIIAQQTSTSAAQLCRNLGADWYLPSHSELELLGDARVAINNILANDGNSATNGLTISNSSPYGFYWSSTERANNDAWVQRLLNGNMDNNFKVHTCRVRAVRAF